MAKARKNKKNIKKGTKMFFRKHFNYGKGVAVWRKHCFGTI